MSTVNTSKLNQLLQLQPPGVVLTSRWLSEQGYSFDLLRKYRNSGWLESIGRGAMVRKGDKVEYQGAVYALQCQLGLKVHAGGKTALALLGRVHYLEFGIERIYLFGATKESIPAWFQEYDWRVNIQYYTTDFLPYELGLIALEGTNFDLTISSPARALMECLYLAPANQDLVECYELMQGLNNLHPKLVQQLLLECSSIKVKRLFLYLAEKSGHEWFGYLNYDVINLGSGKRSIVENGIYIDKYQITVPRELE